MPAFLIPSLIAGGTSLLGGLMNKDPYDDIMRRVMAITSPRALNANTTAIYRNWLGSPAFGASKMYNMGAANTLRSQMQGRLGASGLGSSGVGQMAQSLANSSFGPMMSQLYAGGWNNASQMAQQLANLRLQGLGMAGQPQNIGGLMMGSGLGALGNILAAYAGAK